MGKKIIIVAIVVCLMILLAGSGEKTSTANGKTYTASQFRAALSNALSNNDLQELVNLGVPATGYDAEGQPTGIDNSVAED